MNATGVPLLAALQPLTTQQAAVRCAGLIAAAALGVAVSNKLLEIMGQKVRSLVSCSIECSCVACLRNERLLEIMGQKMRANVDVM